MWLMTPLAPIGSLNLSLLPKQAVEQFNWIWYTEGLYLQRLASAFSICSMGSLPDESTDKYRDSGWPEPFYSITYKMLASSLWMIQRAECLSLFNDPWKHRYPSSVSLCLLVLLFTVRMLSNSWGCPHVCTLKLLFLELSATRCYWKWIE